MPNDRLNPESPTTGPSTALQLHSATDVSTLVLPPSAGAAEDEELHFLDLWRVIVKRKWTVIAFFAIAVVTALLATFLMTPIYQAVITLQIDREAPKIVEYKNVTPSELQGDQDFYQTQYTLLKSRTLAERVMDQMNLKQNQGFGGSGALPWWVGLLKKDEADTASAPDAARRIKEQAITAFLRALSVEPVHNSRLVKVYFASPDPRLAAEVLNNIAQNFININLERRFQASSYAKRFLQENLAQTKAKLEDSERTLADFQRAQQIINVDDNKNILSQTLAEADLAAANAQQERVKAEAQYKEFDSAPESAPAALADRAIQTLKEQRAKMQADYQDMLRVYKPAFPKMQALNASILELQRKIKAETEVVRRSIAGTYKAAVAQDNSAKAELESTKQAVLDLQSRSIQYNILKRDVDTNRQLYEGLLQRLKEVSIAGGIGINNIAVIDPAEPPILPYRPRLSFNLLIAVIFGLGGGVALAFFLDHLDDTLHTPDEMEHLTRLPVLGVVPDTRPEKGKEDQALALVAHTDPRSAIAEAYRSVRTALQFSTREGAPKHLVVTSAVSGEGKTTTALALAINLAQTGKMVLVVDADLRNPSLHKQLGVENTRGLTNFLSSDLPALAVVRPTQVPNLYCIPSGQLPPNPVELLSGPKLLNLVTQLDERFSHIIFDAPPVLGIADAIVLGNQIGTVLFMVSAGKTRKAHVRAALKRLRQASVVPIGALMTRLDLRDGMYGYESAYYYYKSTNDAPQIAGG
ncbi:MAG: GumC family protein [Casimicrobiaceae bacterium]